MKQEVYRFKHYPEDVANSLEHLINRGYTVVAMSSTVDGMNMHMINLIVVVTKN